MICVCLHPIDPIFFQPDKLFYHVSTTSLFIHHLGLLINDLDNCFIVGDFNVDYLTKSHPIIDFLLSQGFKQLVKVATHEQGSLLDYAFVRSHSQYDFDLHWPYYTDHAAVCIVALV